LTRVGVVFTQAQKDQITALMKSGDTIGAQKVILAELNTEFGAGFVGRRMSDIDIVIDVDRGRQRAAIGCHASQSEHNLVLWRRLDLLGDREYLRWLTPQPAAERPL